VEMGLAGGIARVKRREAPLSAEAIVAMATIDGARALGLDDAIGSLEAGKQADVAVVDVTGPSCAPFAEDDPYTALVFGAAARDVTLTMVAGRVLYELESWTTLDPNRVGDDARREGRALLERARAAGLA